MHMSKAATANSELQFMELKALLKKKTNVLTLTLNPYLTLLKILTSHMVFFLLQRRLHGTRMGSVSGMETITTWRSCRMAEPVYVFLLSCLKTKAFIRPLPAMSREMPFAQQNYMLSLLDLLGLQVISHPLK